MPYPEIETWHAPESDMTGGDRLANFSLISQLSTPTKSVAKRLQAGRDRSYQTWESSRLNSAEGCSIADEVALVWKSSSFNAEGFDPEPRGVDACSQLVPELGPTCEKASLFFSATY